MAGHDPATPFGRNIIEYQGHTVVMARRYVEAEFNRQNVGSALKLGAMKGGFELTQDFEGTTCEDILAYWGKKIGMQGLAALATKMFGMGMVAAYNAVDIAINNEDYRAAMLQLLSEVRTMSEIAGTDPISAIYNAAKGGPDALVKLIEMGIYYKISTTIENTINGTPKPSNTAPKKQPNPSQNPPKPPPPAGGSGDRSGGGAPNNVEWNNGWRTPDGKFASPNGAGRGGAAAEQSVWDAVRQKPGWDVIEGQVGVRNASGQLRYYDGAAVSPRGRVIGLEVKSGSAVKTGAQRTFDAGVNTFNPASGVGQNAGLEVGRSLEIGVP